MPADRLLNTVLRAYQDAPSTSRTDKILGTTNALLTSLNNPLNLSLLTSHFLIARSVWQQPDGLRTCLRIISIFNTAAIHVRRNELDSANPPAGSVGGQPPVGSGVRADDWARAVAKGLDDKSSRWQHTLVLAGILMGMEGEDRRSLSWRLRSTLEQAVVTAANLSLGDNSQTGVLGRGAVVLALTYAFPLLSGANKALLNGNTLLPAVVEAMLAEEGFQQGGFIPAIEFDIAPTGALGWLANSPSVNRIQQLESRPLAQNMGPLSRLGAFAVEHAGDSDVVLRVQDELLLFTADLLGKWEHCALSLVDLSVESTTLSPDVLQGPWLMLWQLMKKIMFAVVAILQPMVGRCLLDPRLRNNTAAPIFAKKTLHILRNISFISSRQGGNTFQAYTFTYLTSLDILTRYPDSCASFLQETLPPPSDVVPPPVYQALTLFYLNTAEHLPLSLPTPSVEALIIAPASANLAPASWLTSPANAPPSSLTLELFESSHSALLSVFSCPQHGALAAPLVPFYIDALLSSFPARISPRQFRLAFRTVMQVASPPYPISVIHPDLSETLLEMLRFRAEGAAAAAPPLPLPPTSDAADPLAGLAAGPVSEQAALVLALIDALPYLPVHLLDEWLSRAAEASTAIPDPQMRDVARRRLWEILASGELDVDRAVAAVTWWGTRGGRDMVGGGAHIQGEFMMSGALVHDEKERSRL
ncbi:putative peroxin 8 [Rosellinia necatrix]|uniref:Putative peroxin 8 n=1 Tax=Rosellinia necatrix TaxID=77044 RepID=A0A1W2THZ3_ROSNE|nr:putative peroxin 8 [Rosellinia necatrix]